MKDHLQFCGGATKTQTSAMFPRPVNGVALGISFLIHLTRRLSIMDVQLQDLQQDHDGMIKFLIKKN